MSDKLQSVTVFLHVLQINFTELIQRLSLSLSEREAALAH